MYTRRTKSGPRGVNAVGEEHLQAWHVLSVPIYIHTVVERIIHKSYMIAAQNSNHDSVVRIFAGRL